MLRCGAQTRRRWLRCYDAMLKKRNGDGAMERLMRCDAKNRDGDGAMLRCGAQTRRRWSDGAMRCSKRDGDGAMERCGAQRWWLRCDAKKTRRRWSDAILKNAMAMERCYDAMLKYAMVMERCYCDARKRDGDGAMLLRCDVPLPCPQCVGKNNNE